MANDPFSGTNTRNILEHIISPKIVSGPSGYQAKVDMSNVDIFYPNTIVTKNLQVLADNIIGSNGQSLIPQSGDGNGVYTNMTVDNQLVVDGASNLHTITSTGTAQIYGNLNITGTSNFINSTPLLNQTNIAFSQSPSYYYIDFTNYSAGKYFILVKTTQSPKLNPPAFSLSCFITWDGTNVVGGNSFIITPTDFITVGPCSSYGSSNDSLSLMIISSVATTPPPFYLTMQLYSTAL